MASNVYVCTLNERSLEKAKTELNENPADRMNAVESFKNLIKTRAPHISCGQDTTFLLQFLRVAKFSQLEALKRLEKYLELFAKLSDFMFDIDLTDTKIQNLYSEGYCVPLGYDDEGCRVVIFRLASFDPNSKKYDKKSIKKAIAACMIYQNWDENTAVNGYKALYDCSGFKLKHQMFWTLHDLAESAHFYNGSFPYRWKKIFIYNYNPAFLVVFNLIYPFLKQKVRDRIVMCGDNLESIYDGKIAKHLLPVEYLPDDYTGPNNGTIKELVDKMKAEMLKPEAVIQLKYETSLAFRLDESKRPKDDPPLQSFRKLNVD